MIEPVLKIINGIVRLQEKQSFTVGAYGVAIGNNKSMLSILNASTKVMKLHGLYIVNSQTTAVTGVVSIFQLLRITGHSAGTTLTPLTHDLSDTIDASITARTNGTMAGESTDILRRWLWSSDEWGTGTLDVEAAALNSQQTSSLIQNPHPLKALTFRQNQGFTVKHVVNSTAGTFDIVALLSQE